MASQQSWTISDPSQLPNTTIEATRSEPQSQSQSQTGQLRLVLLQPLANPSMLAACRNPSSRILRFPDGSASNGIGDENLDLTQNPADASPSGRDAEEGGTKFQQIYWNTSTPLNGRHVTISAGDVMRLAVTIATVTRIKIKGHVDFGVSFDNENGPSGKAMRLLRSQLQAIANTTVATG
ncbi:hypothetical protein GGR57DRAFT_500263 [Xylariaceae sp. FL1272]|nr:hypothetical protein GGR57DRAFT_500263 [Xylariaceae sp. FL1272]